MTDRTHRSHSTVSAVVPVCNGENTIARAISSALRQTVPPDEVIVVDDGSTDGTNEECARFAGSVKYIRQENSGVSAARNRGVEEARGDLIAFLDSDDEWEPHKLEVQLASLATHPDAGWSLTGCVVVDEAGRPVPGRQGFERVFGVFKDLGGRAEDLFKRYLERVAVSVGGIPYRCFVGDAFGMLFLGNVALPSSMIVKRELFEETGGFDRIFRVAEDTEFAHRLAASAPVVLVEAPLVRYRASNQGSLTAPTNTIESIRNALRSLERARSLRSKLRESESESYRTGRHRLLLSLAYAHLSVLERSRARSTIARAWRMGMPVTVRSISYYGVALAPVFVLRGLHRLVRSARHWRERGRRWIASPGSIAGDRT